jgi:hypothetical protein
MTGRRKDSMASTLPDSPKCEPCIAVERATACLRNPLSFINHFRFLVGCRDSTPAH